MAHAAFHWQDPFLLQQQLSEDERLVQAAAADYCQQRLGARVTEAFRHGHTDVAIFREMGALGLLGPTIPEQYGGPGLNYVSYGLIAREVERVDSGYRSMMSVQSSLVCLNIFQRGDSQYDKIYWQMVEKGEELYKRVVNVQILKNWLITRCTQQECPTLPPPSLEESDYLYAVRSQQAYIDHGHTKNLIYEAWSWVEYGLSHCSLETLTTIAQRLADWTLQAESHPVACILAEVPPYRVLIQPFSAHQVSFLTIEPINPYDNSTKLSERHLTLATLQHEADQLATHTFRQLLARAARRVYPQDLCCEPADWLAVQRNYAANLAFSPEESDILHFTQQQERPFPLFINGRAGSGKSTILQYLFADYLQHAHHQHLAAETALYPVYFTCNQTLTSAA